MSRRLAFDVLRLADEGVRAREALAGAAQAGAPQAGASGRASEDRALASEIALGVLRTEGALDEVLRSCSSRPLERVDRAVLLVLRIGAYQVLHLDRVPPRAAVHTAVELVRDIGHPAAAGFVNAVLRGVVRLSHDVADGELEDFERGSVDEGAAADERSSTVHDERSALPRSDGGFVPLARPLFPDPAADLAGNLAARYAVPRPAVARWLGQRGEAAVRAILAASIARPPIALRPAAGRAGQVESALAAARVAFEREGPCLLVRGVGDVRDLPLFGAGAFAVQDPTAAEVVPFAGAKARERILDLCAAPGGKTFALAEAVGPAGRVVAVDVSAERLAPLRDEAARRGVANVEVVEADATDAAALPAGPFDLVLVDVPCSNSGVLSRRVEARRRLTDPSHLDSLVALQDALLRAAATRVRPGGRLILSTCSIDDEEDAARVRAFLASTAGFVLEEERLTLPVPGRRDGGYVARLRRAASSSQESWKPSTTRE